MQVRDLLHAKPTELTAADGAGHVIAASVVHLDDVGCTARAWFDVITWCRIKHRLNIVLKMIKLLCTVNLSQVSFNV